MRPTPWRLLWLNTGPPVGGWTLTSLLLGDAITSSWVGFMVSGAIGVFCSGVIATVWQVSRQRFTLVLTADSLTETDGAGRVAATIPLRSISAKDLARLSAPQSRASVSLVVEGSPGMLVSLVRYAPRDREAFARALVLARDAAPNPGQAQISSSRPFSRGLLAFACSIVVIDLLMITYLLCK